MLNVQVFPVFLSYILHPTPSPPFYIQKPTSYLIGAALSRKKLWFEVTLSTLVHVQGWEECEILASGAAEVLVREVHVPATQPHEAVCVKWPMEAPGRMHTSADPGL